MSDTRPYDPALFGPMIKRRRLERHWSQRTLAGKLNISHTYVSQYERGRQVDITLSFLRDLMAVLEMTWDELVAEGGINVAMVPEVTPQQERELSKLERAATKLSLAELHQLIDYAEWLVARGEQGDVANQSPRRGPGGDQGPLQARGHGGAAGVG